VTNRNLEIDTLRGLACILLVVSHVIGFSPIHGLKLSEGFLREGNDFLAYVRMPLFTFLSGYVYAYRPFRTGAVQFIKGKARRLLVPMLVVGTFFAVVQTYTPGANGGVENWYLLHLKPYAHFWFVESLFLIFLLVVPLEISKAMSSKFSMAFVFVLASLLYISGFAFTWFSVSGAIYLLPYFILGIALCRFSVVDHCKQYRVGFYIIGVLAAMLPLVIEGADSQRTLLSLVVGGAACAALLMTRMRVTWLARIGSYSYAIYLYHVFFTAACRIFSNRLGIDSMIVLFAVGSVAGLIGPIVVEVISDKHGLSRLLFLGKSSVIKPANKFPEGGQASNFT
jgi:fucose 4-O-acetylase-like acetyltransferase